MAYSVQGTFSSEFWLAPGEPYDCSDYTVNDKNQPVTVWSAVCMALDNPEQRKDIETALQWEHAEIPIPPEVVFQSIIDTNTCGTLRTPVDMWIDKEGDCKVYVYDSR